MNNKMKDATHSSLTAEFDSLADEYYAQHTANVAITGERPEYFAEYKVADLTRLALELNHPPRSILDFGCGIGNSIPHFREYFSNQDVTYADISKRSIELASARFPGNENYCLIAEERLPLEDESQDITFSACVFHHIPPVEHHHWLSELRRVTRRGGMLVIFEHNPFNPLTLRAVNTCPLDVNAKLISGPAFRKAAESAGWARARIDYRLFFPAALARMRPLEQRLTWLPLGAQYRLVARRIE